MTQHTDGERYRFLRTLTPIDFQRIWQRSLRLNCTLDSEVDEAIHLRRIEEDEA